MYLSKNLLTSFFPQFSKLKNKDFEKYFNSIGIEVETIFNFEKTENLIVAKIIETKPHPKSEKFTLCKVKANNKIYDVVCGSPNVENNSLIIFALPGTKMLDGRVILEKEILGIKSNGMICGYDELTKRSEYLSEEVKNKIIKLDSNAKLNDKNPLKYIGFDDTIFDLSIPSNRSDLNSVLGIAYDLFPFLNLKMENHNFKFKSINKNQIDIKNNSDVDFFSILNVNVEKIKHSSWKIKGFLMNSGIKLNNSIVNLCNLVSLLTGNTIKTFVSNKQNINVDISKVNKSISFSLNKDNYKVGENNILYKLNNDLISINGVNFFNEQQIENINICIFNTNSINLKNVNNNFSFNINGIEYIKKVSLYFSMKSIEIILSLLSSASIKINSWNYISHKFKTRYLSLDYKRIISLLGNKISLAQVSKILKKMGFQVVGKKLLPPIYRNDILTTNDVVEEILKSLNINDSNPVPIISTNIEFVENNIYKNNCFIKNYFLNRGFFILKTYNLTSIENNKNFNLFNSKDDYLITNPISTDKEVMRNNLIEKQLNVLFENNSYKNEIYSSFEIQKVYIDKKCETHMAGIISDDLFDSKIGNSLIENNIFLVKSLLIDLFRYFSIDLNFEKIDSLNSLSYLNNNNLLTIKDGKNIIGYLGQVSSIYLNKNDYKKNVFFFELKIDNYLNLSKNDSFKIKPIDNKHLIVRDLSIIVKENEFKHLDNVIKLNADIVKYTINSIYQINDNESSYNISFIFKNTDKQLTNDEINVMFNNLISLLNENNFNIRKNNL